MRNSLSVVQEESEVRRDSGHGFRPRGSCGSHGRFLGVEVDNVSPKVQVSLASTVLMPVLLSGLLLVVFVPQLWWIFTTYGWVSFPAFGLLARGMAGLSTSSPGQEALSSSASKERELLAALSKYEELTPAQATIHTSLSVSEADEKLKELADGGHLEVRVHGGGLFYALWGANGAEREREIS